MGAFYLFFINSVFISLSTFLIVRFLKYPNKEFVDPAKEKRVKQYITAFVIFTILPSIYLGIQVVQQSIFEKNAYQFIRSEFSFENARVISTNVDFESDPPIIEISLFGDRIEQVVIDNALNKKEQYKLSKTDIKVFQGYDQDKSLDVATVERMNLNLRTGIIEDLYRRNEAMLANKDEQIQLLEGEIMRIKQAQVPLDEIGEELIALHPNVRKFTIQPGILKDFQSNQMDTTYIAYVDFSQRPNTQERNRMENWLRARLKTEKLKLIIE